MLSVRPVPGHPGYQVSSSGEVIGKSGKTLRQFPGKDGYSRFTTFHNGSWQQVSTHVMVCSAFHGPRPDWADLAAHNNGDRTDNRAENLRWATFAQNEADKRAHGRNMFGERHHHALLTESQVLEIRRRRSAGEKGRHLAREFEVTETTISAIHRRRAWRHLP